MSLVKNGAPAGVIITTPYMRIRAVQRAPYRPEYVRGCGGSCCTCRRRRAFGQRFPKHTLFCDLFRSLATAQLADPLYGEWLDVYITLLQPLVTPVTGLLGECRLVQQMLLAARALAWGAFCKGARVAWMHSCAGGVGSVRHAHHTAASHLQAPPTSRRRWRPRRAAKGSGRI